MSKYLSGLMIVVLAVTSGCGSAEPTGANGTAANGSKAAPSDPIARTVHDFFTAVKQGDSELAGSKLTPLAQQLMKQSKQGFALIPDQAASFQVGTVERIEDAQDQAAVNVLWMEPDEAGKMERQQWVVALRREAQGWGIIGIVGDAPAGEEPMMLDFEATSQNYNVQTQPNSEAQQNSVPQQATRPAATDPFRQ